MRALSTAEEDALRRAMGEVEAELEQEAQAVEEMLTQQVLLQEVLVFNQLNQAIVVLTDLEIQEAQAIQEVPG